MKLDSTNITILRTLLNEARTPLTSLAKQLNISIPSVSSRIEYMKKKGIIKGSLVQINPEKLGFSCCGVLQIFTAEENKQSVKKFLEDRHLLFYNNEYFSKSSFGVFFVLRNNDELFQLINNIKRNSKILDVIPLIYNDLAKLDFPENLIFPTFYHNKNIDNIFIEKKEIQNTKKNEKNVRLDDYDIKIAKTLVLDAQVPFSKIAKQIGISTNNVISRYKRMRRSGAISNSFTAIDLTKLDYNAMIVLLIKTSPEISPQELYNRLISMSNVIVSTKILGPHDLMVIVPISNLKEVFKLKEKIYSFKGVGRVEVELHAPYTHWPLNIFAHVLNKL